MLTVLKFGGSSLGDAARVLGAAARAVALVRQENRVVVVVSAQGDMTNELMKKIQAMHHQVTAREVDACLATGEQLSAALLAAAVQSLGVPAVSLTGWQAGVKTDGNAGDARVLGLEGTRIRQELDRGNVVVVAGFQGVGPGGDITTLGRGGSDTTAVALAAYLGADRCRIYTDVDGVYNRDPRKHPDAVKFSKIGYEDMLKLSRSGAQVLHDRAVELAREYRVPVEVLSSFRAGPGTMVSD